MNGDKFLLDTNILIGMHQHSPDVFDRVLASGATTTQSSYSALTRIELLGYPNLTQAEVSVLESLLDKLQRYPLDQAIEDAAIQIRRAHRVKLPDAIILGTGQVHRLTLLTLDKDLDRLAKLLPGYST